jgi:phosphoglucosamine mutase
VAYLARTFRADAGIDISASHNPLYDNGNKFFSSEGTKLPDEVERAIEAQMDIAMTTVDSSELGKAKRIVDAAGRYIEFCKATAGGISLKGLKIILDCANGATYHVAPSVFTELGAKVVEIASSPDGLNINEKCGATETARLRTVVLAEKADLGIALDGDGDRVIMVDQHGEEVDGDELLFIIAAQMRREGVFSGGVVGTLMSNFGLEQAFAREDIPFIRAKVGDRYVMEQLDANDWILGGESSGHIVCRHLTTTGDGTVAALQVLKAIVETGKTLSELRHGMTKMPQTMINVRIAQKVNIDEIVSIQQAVSDIEQQLGERGRVLLRPSGTEPLVRVMIEGEDADEVANLCQQLASDVEKALMMLES